MSGPLEALVRDLDRLDRDLVRLRVERRALSLAVTPRPKGHVSAYRCARPRRSWTPEVLRQLRHHVGCRGARQADSNGYPVAAVMTRRESPTNWRSRRR